MSITGQLYQLQELDNEIEAAGRALDMKTAQLGDRRSLDEARGKIDAMQEHLQELRKKQHDAEWALDDVTGKIKDAEQQLYGGKVNNPKELSNLQHEVNSLKTQSDEIETTTLEIIDHVEAAEQELEKAEKAFGDLEDEWAHEQQQLSADIEELKSQLADLNGKRGKLGAEVDSEMLALYQKLRNQKKQAVARVEQGICRGCRISVSASEVQHARSGVPVQCSSCGRILFLP